MIAPVLRHPTVRALSAPAKWLYLCAVAECSARHVEVVPTATTADLLADATARGERVGILDVTEAGLWRPERGGMALTTIVLDESGVSVMEGRR